MKREVRDLRQKILKLEKDLSDVGERRDELSAEVESLEAALDEARSRVVTEEARSEELQARLVEVELESYQRVEETRGRAEAEVAAREAELARYREQEREVLVERERLQQSEALLRSRLAETEAARDRALEGADRTRALLDQVRLELAGQSMELGKISMGQRNWEKALATGTEPARKTVF